MSNLYETLLSLCQERGIKGAKMAEDCGLSKNIMTELKMGRKNGVSAKTANKIANYFGVTVGYLLGEKENAPTDGESALQRLKDDERALLHSYRTMTDQQRQMMEVFIRGLKHDD